MALVKHGRSDGTDELAREALAHVRRILHAIHTRSSARRRVKS